MGQVDQGLGHAAGSRQPDLFLAVALRDGRELGAFTIGQSIALDHAHAREALLGAMADLGQAFLHSGRVTMQPGGEDLHGHRDEHQRDRHGQGQHRRDAEEHEEAPRDHHQSTGDVHHARAEQHADVLHIRRQAAHDVPRATLVVERQGKAAQLVEQVLLQLDFDAARDSYDPPALKEAKDALGQSDPHDEEEEATQELGVGTRSQTVEGIADQERDLDVAGGHERDAKGSQGQTLPMSKEALIELPESFQRVAAPSPGRARQLCSNAFTLRRSRSSSRRNASSSATACGLKVGSFSAA